jgi:HK97 family phage portal protein
VLELKKQKFLAFVSFSSFNGSMNLKDLFSKLFRRINKKPVAVKKNAAPFTFAAWREENEIEPVVDYQTFAQDGYRRNSVVYSCIRKIATTAPSAPFIVEQTTATDVEKVPNHFIVKLLKKPNFFTSSFLFAEQIHTFLNLAGECFIIYDDSQEPAQMFFSRPDRIKPIPLSRELLGFLYVTEDGEKLPFLPENIIHIKYPDPLDEFEGLGRGLPPLSAAAYEADADNKASAYLRDFFNNAAIPFGLLTTENVLDDPEVKRIRNRLKAQYSGEFNWAEVMILDASAKYQQLGLDFDKMAFGDIRRMSEARICAVFDVPPVLVGVQVGLQNQGAFVSNVGESRKALWLDKIIPDNRRISEAFNRFFAERGELKENESILHDYSSIQALQEDRNAQFRRAVDGFNSGVLTQNEARQEIGLSPDNEGNFYKKNPKFTEKGAQK